MDVEVGGCVVVVMTFGETAWGYDPTSFWTHSKSATARANEMVWEPPYAVTLQRPCTAAKSRLLVLVSEDLGVSHPSATSDDPAESQLPQAELRRNLRVRGNRGSTQIRCKLNGVDGSRCSGLAVPSKSDPHPQPQTTLAGGGLPTYLPLVVKFGLHASANTRQRYKSTSLIEGSPPGTSAMIRRATLAQDTARRFREARRGVVLPEAMASGRQLPSLLTGESRASVAHRRRPVTEQHLARALC
ncbi:hypothetical protein BKA56DRAFT_621530 [Ilyonectria sp. MPI-CAGE-AT-0026]|nr:hypothetical protein BKA56DRAFT_621530 [Ilyonectria sp. MPI-CAGE-AT-0026]